jgi:hypothetical protein
VLEDGDEVASMNAPPKLARGGILVRRWVPITVIGGELPIPPVAEESCPLGEVVRIPDGVVGITLGYPLLVYAVQPDREPHEEEALY